MKVNKLFEEDWMEQLTNKYSQYPLLHCDVVFEYHEALLTDLPNTITPDQLFQLCKLTFPAEIVESLQRPNSQVRMSKTNPERTRKWISWLSSDGTKEHLEKLCEERCETWKQFSDTILEMWSLTGNDFED